MKVVIVGGGLAGSALAMALVRVRPQVHLTVLDAPDRPRASTIPAALCHPLTGWSMGSRRMPRSLERWFIDD